MGDAKFSFFITDIIILLVFLGLIKIIFKLKGIGFLIELLFLAVLLLAAFIALIPAYSGSRGAWGSLAVIFLMVLLDLFALYLKKDASGKIFIGALLLSAIGFAIAVLNIKTKSKEDTVSEEEPEKGTESPVYTNFEPGKYVASRTGSTYHIPKCDWAKKIHKKNLVWFDNEEDAKKQYKAHSCIE